MIGEQRNFDDSFIRMVGTALVKTMSRCVTWINYFEDTRRRVVVPFYISMAGDDNFVLDAFVDDIAASRVELNTDQIPRGIVTFNNFSTKSDEYANPNQYISKKAVINGEMKSFVQKTKGIPVDINYDVEIVLDSEIDVYKATEKIMIMLFNYAFINIDYFGIKIDAVFNLPDDKNIEVVRENTLDSETKKYIKFPLTIHTYYPSFYDDSDDYIICDNDDDIDWSRMCKTKPSERDNSDMSRIRKVYWKNWIWDYDYKETPKPDGDDRWDDTPKENF